MKKFNTYYVALLLAVMSFGWMSAAVAPVKTTQAVVTETTTALPSPFEQLSAGELSLKDRLVLKALEKKVKKAEKARETKGEKSQLTAALICFFVGSLGIHRFYLGYTWQGVVQLLTLGGLGIWTLIDFVRILIGDLQPKGGKYDKTFND